MNPAIELIADLRGRGVVLAAYEGTLTFDAPAGVLSVEDRETMRVAKYAMLAALIMEKIPEEAEALREAWVERAAIAEFDGNLPRPEAERAAYTQLVEAVQGIVS